MSNCVTCESRTYRHLSVRKTILEVDELLFIFPDVQIVFEGIKGKFVEEESDTDSQDIEAEKPKQHREDIVGQ